ncbi:HAD family hydrolase [Streptomyces sp. NPDC020996]|uniref:HAD family hydrolase n=1 Tax=Streptomyces sp. NPDC020996 TaxID=3154791 RepID=UPI0033CFA5C4
MSDLRAAGFRLVTMTNGDAALAEWLLTAAGVADAFEGLLDVSGPRAWKPAPAAYRYAVGHAGVPPERALLVAVHPRDVDGARRTGLGGTWPRRGPIGRLPRTTTPPTHTAEDLSDLAARLTAARA